MVRLKSFLMMALTVSFILPGLTAKADGLKFKQEQELIQRLLNEVKGAREAYNNCVYVSAIGHPVGLNVLYPTGYSFNYTDQYGKKETCSEPFDLPR